MCSSDLGDRRDFLNQPEERSFLNDLLANIEVQMDELTVRRGSLALGRTVMEMEVRAKGDRKSVV